jgi:hypothetical protein
MIFNVRGVPHITCSCKYSFSLNNRHINISYYKEVNSWSITVNCPKCFNGLYYNSPTLFFNEYFNIIYDNNDNMFNNHTEAIDYYIAYCKLNQLLESK